MLPVRARAWSKARLGTTSLLQPLQQQLKTTHQHQSPFNSSPATIKTPYSTKMADSVGVTFPNGCRITHGAGANVKKPFPDLDLTMHELSPSNKPGFKGQLGFIEFTPAYRLPRHIHMTSDMSRLVDERILVLHGVGLVEIAGEIFAAAPGTLVDAKGGVPHTWTACPKGVKLPDGSVSEGRFTMVYEYEEPTMFYPTASTEIVADASQYRKFEGTDYEEIRFPKLTKEEVVERAKVVFGRETHRLSLA